MNFAEIENLWRSPQNRPSAAEMEQQKMKFATDLRRRRRRFVTFIALVFTALTVITGIILVRLPWSHLALARADFSREWGVLLLLALPWTAALVFAYQYRVHRAQHNGHERSLAQGVRALLDENRLARTRLKAVAILHGVLLGVLPLVVYQLRAVGKAGDEIVIPAFVVWPIIALGIGLAMHYHYRQTLLPRKHELETLLKSYEGLS